MSTKQLASNHRQHLLSDGFSSELIDFFLAQCVIESLSPEDSYSQGFAVAIDGKPNTGGLLLRFSKTYAQLRLDNQEIILKDRTDSDSKYTKYAKYLSQGGAIDLGCAYIPEGIRAVTEGIKDALAFTHIGGIPTGAVAGVNHVTKALPKGCGYTVVFDYDAWSNFEVFRNLIKAGVHCDGKVAIVPEIEGEPKAGGCEYFKAGHTAADYQQLLDDAQTPNELFKTWFDRQQITDVVSAVKLAVNTGKLLGEIHGYATSIAVDALKQVLKASKLSEWNLTPSNIIRDSHNTQKALKAKEKDEDETDPRKAVKIAIEIVKARANLFHSQAPDSEDYATIPSKDGEVMTTHSLASSEFKSWVNGEYYRETGDGLTSEQMNTILATIHAIAAHDSPEIPVSEQRIAAHKGRYYLYLADESQTVIEYSAVGWSICENSPVKFVFDRYKAPLPIPCRNGKIDKLWDIVRITDPNDRLAVAAILVKVLVPEGTDPILALSGYAGSGKTTTANYLRSLIDPFTKGHVLAKIPDIDHLAIHGKKRRIIAIDNLSHITAEQSNILCGVSTKTSMTKRKLHSDAGEIVFDVANLIILTSIGNVVIKFDLLSRSINIELSKLTDNDRTSESKLKADFERHHGEMLGGLLNMAVYALNYRDTTECPTFNRMTEFVHLGMGVEKYLGYSVGSLLKRIKWGESEAHTIAIESSPTASTIVDWIKSKGEWTGSTSELFNTLKSHAKKSEQSALLPKNASKLGAEIRMVESALLEQGIEICIKRQKAGVYITISNTRIGGDLPTPPTPKPEQLPIEDSKDVGNDVGKENLPTPLSILPESKPSKYPSDGVGGVGNNTPILDPSNTHITDDEYPYLDGDV